MSTLTFILKEPNSLKETLVLGVHKLYKKETQRQETVKFSTGLKIKPKYWNKKRGQGQARYVSEFPQADEFNAALRTFKNDFDRFYYKLKSQNKEITKDILKRAYQEFKNPPNHLNLNDFIKDYIEKMESGEILAEKKQGGNVVYTKYRKGTIKNYKGFQAQFNLFQKKQGLRYNYNDIDMDFYDEFIQFFNEKDASLNTIGKHIKHIRKLMRYAMDKRNYHNNTIYREFDVLGANTIKVGLTSDELDKLYFLDLSKKPYYELARDVFLCGCYTALRYCDYSRLSNKYIKLRKDKNENIRKVIDIITEKTNERVVIPLNPIVEEIINKYGGKLPLTYEQKLNKYIKKVCEIAKINEEIEVEKTIGGSVQKSFIHKFDLIKTHTARRTGATLMYLNGMEILDIMQITGHTTQKNLLKYICIEKDDTAMRVSQNKYFTRKPVPVSE